MHIFIATHTLWIRLNILRCIRNKGLKYVRAFFICNTFTSNTRPILTKSQAKVKKYLETEILLSENYSLSSSTLSSKNNRRYSKKCAKTILSISRLKRWKYLAKFKYKFYIYGLFRQNYKTWIIIKTFTKKKKVNKICLKYIK